MSYIGLSEYFYSYPFALIKGMNNNHKAVNLEPLIQFLDKGVAFFSVVGEDQFYESLERIREELDQVVTLILSDDKGDELTRKVVTNHVLDQLKAPLDDGSSNNPENKSQPTTKLEAVCHRWESTIG